MNKQEMIDSLEEILTLLKEREFPESVVFELGWTGIRAVCAAPEEFAGAARALGTFEKNPIGNILYLDRKCGAIELSVSIDRAKTCRKIVKGTRVVPATRREVKTYVTEAQPERVEEVVEWECPESILALGAAPADLEPAKLAEGDEAIVAPLEPATNSEPMTFAPEA